MSEDTQPAYKHDPKPGNRSEAIRVMLQFGQARTVKDLIEGAEKIDAYINGSPTSD